MQGLTKKHTKNSKVQVAVTETIYTSYSIAELFSQTS